MSSSLVPDIAALHVHERTNNITTKVYDTILRCFSKDPEQWQSYNELQDSRLKLINTNRDLSDYNNGMRSIINRWNKVALEFGIGIKHGPSEAGDPYDGCILVDVYHRICKKNGKRQLNVVRGKLPNVFRVEPSFAQVVFKHPDDVIENIDQALDGSNNIAKKRKTRVKATTVKSRVTKHRKTRSLKVVTNEVSPSPSPDYRSPPPSIDVDNFDADADADADDDAPLFTMDEVPSAHLEDINESPFDIFGFGELPFIPPSDVEVTANITEQSLPDYAQSTAAIENLVDMPWPTIAFGDPLGSNSDNHQNHLDFTQWSVPLTHADDVSYDSIPLNYFDELQSQPQVLLHNEPMVSYFSLRQTKQLESSFCFRDADVLCSFFVS